jgi:hypothetical protein
MFRQEEGEARTLTDFDEEPNGKDLPSEAMTEQIFEGVRRNVCRASKENEINFHYQVS